MGLLLVIAIVGTGALIGHFLGAALMICLSRFSSLIPNPDIYRMFGHYDGFNAGHTLYLILFVLMISGLTYYLARILATTIFAKAAGTIRYGMFAEYLMKTKPKEKLVFAHVLTDETKFESTGTQGAILGYRGIVANIMHDKTGIRSIHLINAVAIHPEKKSGKNTTSKGEAKPIPYLYIPDHKIINLALNVLEID